MNPLQRLFGLFAKAKAGHITEQERGEALQIRAGMQRHAMLRQAQRGGYDHKRRLILEGKGRNGRSMSPSLLAKHGIAQANQDHGQVSQAGA